LPQTLAVAGLKLQSIGQLWDGMTIGERWDAMRILFEQVALDTKARKIWLEPWLEFQALFAHRREWCGLGTPGRSRTRVTHTNPRLFATEELIIASA